MGHIFQLKRKIRVRTNFKQNYFVTYLNGISDSKKKKDIFLQNFK